MQVELMRGEEMTPPEIVQLIAWSKEYAASCSFYKPQIGSCFNILSSYNRDMDRQFAFKPDTPLLVFFDDLLKVFIGIVVIGTDTFTSTTTTTTTTTSSTPTTCTVTHLPLLPPGNALRFTSTKPATS
jgi:hypothetical protein